MSGVALHPTPSASDGREIAQSSFIQKADRLDRMIECAQCGFIVDLSKRSTGPSLGAIGDPKPQTASLTPPRGATVTDQYADPVDTNSGCPFCNSMNPQGAGRDHDPFYASSRTLENL